MKRIALLCLISLGVSISAGWTQDIYSQGGDEITITDEQKERLLGLLPDAEALGLQPDGDPLWYGSDLYMYINGAAPAYHDYDFEGLLARMYKKGEMDLTVEIYDMGRVVDAFGIYSIERSPDNEFVSIGQEGYVYEGGLNFHQGNYYVKLQSFGGGEAAREALKAMGKQISQNIGEVDRRLSEWFYSLFPQEGLVAHSMQYLVKAPLGHEFLSPAFKVSYQIDDHEWAFWICRAEDAEGAQEKFEQLHSHFEKTGEVNEADEIDGAMVMENPYEGTLAAFVRGPLLLVMSNPPANWTQMASAFEQKLEELRQQRRGG